MPAFGTFLILIGALTWLAAVAPAERRGEAIGISFAATFSGELVGPLAGAAAASTGLVLVFSIIAALAFLLAVVAAAMRSPARRSPRSVQPSGVRKGWLLVATMRRPARVRGVQAGTRQRHETAEPSPAEVAAQEVERGNASLQAMAWDEAASLALSLAIADEVRKLRPDLRIDWLAQHPTTSVLEGRGETIHPMSAELASESAHWASESSEHDLNAFQALRRMDEILVSNFMVFHDASDEGEYDHVIADEAWDVDYYLHENPELKRTAFAWMTDFVGWLPMPDGGERESFLTADYNAEMIEHIARFPRVRDRAVYVGDEDDVVSDAFGPELPLIRDWTREHFSFAGYVTGFDPADFGDRAALRHELGYHEDEQVCIVTVGGSGVGGALLRRVIAAYPAAKARVPALRMIVVAGPRIDPASLPQHEGLEVRAYVHNLYRHLAACDLAVVQVAGLIARELGWEELRALGGVELELRVALVRSAYVRLVGDERPGRLRVRTLHVLPDGGEGWSFDGKTPKRTFGIEAFAGLPKRFPELSQVLLGRSSTPPLLPVMAAIFSASTVAPTPRRPAVYSESWTATSSSISTCSTAISSSAASSAASLKFMTSPV